MSEKPLALIASIVDELLQSRRLGQVMPMAIERLQDIRKACDTDTTELQTERQHRALDHYYTVQIEADVNDAIAATKRAMTEAMTNIRMGYPDSGYQQLSVALQRLEERGL